jgi:hypothetical protein
VSGRARKLVNGFAVPIDAQPSELFENSVDRRLRGAFAVGILNAQEHLSATAACVKPIEQSGAGPADMQEAGRRGGKTGDDSHARRIRPDRLRTRANLETKVRVSHIAGEGITASTGHWEIISHIMNVSRDVGEIK